MSSTTDAAAASAASLPVSPHRPDARGLVATIVAFGIWGLFPLYLGMLSAVPALQLVAHRVAWACVLVLGWMALRGQLPELRQAMQPAVLVRLAITALLISANWLAYVWGVTHGHVVETSLGYFINPLVNVVLGVLVLSERLNRAQWSAVALAAAGVVYLTVSAGHLPWIALTLALSFGFYGLLRKMAQVDALPGLAVETALLAPLAAGYLVWAGLHGSGALGTLGWRIDALLVTSGAVTAVPLYLFAWGARRLPYATVGVLQYLAPTIQLGCAVLVFGEPFGRARVSGFALIWIGLLIYAGDGFLRARRERMR